jgi:hypothetical protein
LTTGSDMDPNFKDNHYLEPVPVADARKEDFLAGLLMERDNDT